MSELPDDIVFTKLEKSAMYSLKTAKSETAGMLTFDIRKEHV
ncbi:hypothetical protein [Mucilaginibacter defluvii]